jgi:Na+/H+ antiporter NhaC
LSDKISEYKDPRLAHFAIAKTVAAFDILLANNTIAIIFTGDTAKMIAKQNNIKPHVSAAWLDIFSCVFQGIIPHGAQILLAASIAGLSSLSIIPYVFYCYVLAMVSCSYIWFFAKRL